MNWLKSAKMKRLAVSVALAVGFAESAFAQQAAADTAVAAAEQRFDVMEFEISGNSLLDVATIQSALDSYSGPSKRVEDVIAARAALEDVYRKLGYTTVIVELPSQDVASQRGVIRLNVVEGRVDRVRVVGAQYVLPSEVKAALPSIQTGGVLNVLTLQSQLSDANNRVTRTITPEFRAGQAPGTVDVDLMVEDKKPWGAEIELSDQYNKSTPRWRSNVALSYDNLWQKGHSANIAYQTAPENKDEVRVLSGSYFAPIGYSKTNLLAYAIKTNTEVSTVAGLTVLGKGEILGLTVLKTLDSDQDGILQSALLGVEFKNNSDGSGLSQGPNTDLALRYLPFNAQYRFFGGDRKSKYDFSVGATFAFDGIASTQSEFASKRFEAESSFFYFTGAASYERRFTDDWFAKTSVNWQLAPSPLVSNEQFSVGGASSVRGYREAEILGDSGFQISAIAGRTLPSKWFGNELSSVMDVKVSLFADGGRVFINRPLPAQRARTWISSSGVSTNFELYKKFIGQVDLAYQFKNDPERAGVKLPDDVGGFRAHMKFAFKY